MDLPVMPPVKPMLSKAIKDLPEGDVLYEPKWDAIRGIACTPDGGAFPSIPALGYGSAHSTEDRNDHG